MSLLGNIIEIATIHFWTKTRVHLTLWVVTKTVDHLFLPLLEKGKLGREISDGKNKFLTNFLVAKFSDGIIEGFHVFSH